MAGHPNKHIREAIKYAELHGWRFKEHDMKEHEFTVILASPEESEEDANRLYEARCGDGSVSTSGGVTRIDYHRQAPSLEEAIRSAIGNIQTAGFHVAHVLIEPESIVAPR